MKKSLIIATILSFGWLLAGAGHAFEHQESHDYPKLLSDSKTDFQADKPSLGLPLFSTPEYAIELDAFEPNIDECRNLRKSDNENFGSCLGSYKFRIRIPF